MGAVDESSKLAASNERVRRNCPMFDARSSTSYRLQERRETHAAKKWKTSGGTSGTRTASEGRWKATSESKGELAMPSVSDPIKSSGTDRSRERRRRLT
jgi:hypothetical protein